MRIFPCGRRVHTTPQSTTPICRQNSFRCRSERVGVRGRGAAATATNRPRRCASLQPDASASPHESVCAFLISDSHPAPPSFPSLRSPVSPQRQAKLPTRFPAELEAAAAELAASPVPDEDAATREDLTHLKVRVCVVPLLWYGQQQCVVDCFAVFRCGVLVCCCAPDLRRRDGFNGFSQVITIDSADTTEIDDALSVECLLDLSTDPPPAPGVPTHRVWVHIADPTRFVPLGHPLEEEASRRGTSVYFPAGHVPMFPASLAQGPMSLRQGGESCALTVCVDLDRDAEVVTSRVFPSRLKARGEIGTGCRKEALQSSFAPVGDPGSHHTNLIPTHCDCVEYHRDIIGIFHR